MGGLQQIQKMSYVCGEMKPIGFDPRILKGQSNTSCQFAKNYERF